jgi:hypothetical protein
MFGSPREMAGWPPIVLHSAVADPKARRALTQASRHRHGRAASQSRVLGRLTGANCPIVLSHPQLMFFEALGRWE